MPFQIPVFFLYFLIQKSRNSNSGYTVIYHLCSSGKNCEQCASVEWGNWRPLTPVWLQLCPQYRGCTAAWYGMHPLAKAQPSVKPRDITRTGPKLTRSRHYRPDDKGRPSRPPASVCGRLCKHVCRFSFPSIDVQPGALQPRSSTRQTRAGAQ